MSTDMVDTHVAELARTLRGPGRVRRSMLAETRDGLHDAAAAYRDAGLPAEDAAARAVSDFGTVAELAPLYQDELTARQGRRAALVLAIVFPAVVLGWDLLWKDGIGWRGPSIPTITWLAHLQEVVSWSIGALAAAVLALTFRRGIAPRHLAVAAGVIGTVGALLAGGAAVVMIFGFDRSNSEVFLIDPVAPVAYGCSAAALVVISWTVIRTALTVVRGAQASATSSPTRTVPPTSTSA